MPVNHFKLLLLHLRIINFRGFQVSVLASHNFSLRNIVEENEITEHGDEAEESQASHYVDHCVLQIKLS